MCHRISKEFALCPVSQSCRFSLKGGYVQHSARSRLLYNSAIHIAIRIDTLFDVQKYVELPLYRPQDPRRLSLYNVDLAKSGTTTIPSSKHSAHFKFRCGLQGCAVLITRSTTHIRRTTELNY